MSSTNTKDGFCTPEAVLLPALLFPPVSYYAVMSAAKCAAIDTEMRYDKSFKGIHRFTIADTRGILRLTVPVAHKSEQNKWKEVTVSSHGRWWETMPVALESAYGRTPFFEFYIDRFRKLFSPEPVTVTELCLRADEIVRQILLINTPVLNVDKIEKAKSYLSFDFEKASDFLPHYWQIREDSLGFIGRLSVLDLIFNLGPDAVLYLDRLSTNTVDNC